MVSAVNSGWMKPDFEKLFERTPSPHCGLNPYKMWVVLNFVG